jgi:peptidoglycan hydrolase FlgJ
MTDNLSPNIPGNMITGKTSGGKTAANPEQEKKLKKACADFESMLVYQLLKTMRQTVPKGGFLNRSQGQETYEMMLDQKVAEELSKKGQGLGLQKMLYNQIVKQQIKKD